MKSPDLVIYGKLDCEDLARSRALLDGLGIPFEFHDFLASVEEHARVREISGRASSPTIVFADGSFLIEPTDDELLEQLTAHGLVRQEPPK